MNQESLKEPGSKPGKARRRWLQFSLRSLVVLIVVAACVMGFVLKVRDAQQKRELAEALTEAGAVVYFGYEIDETGNFVSLADPPGPGWLTDNTSDLLFSDVCGVTTQDMHTVGGLESLAGLSEVKSIIWTFNEPPSLEPLREFKKLERLWLVCKGDCAPIGELHQLRDLWILNQQLENLDFLRGTQRIEKLTLSCGQLVNFEPIAGLPELRELTLNCFQLSSVQPFAGAPNLETLRVQEGLDELDLESLSTFPNLHTFAISGSQLEFDFDHIAAVNGLRKLALTECNPPERTQVEQMIANGLNEIELTQCQWVKSGASLEVFEGIPAISIIWCPIESLDGVQELNGLKSLHLHDYQSIPQLNALDGFVELESFAFGGHTQLDSDDMHVLRTMTGLRRLRCYPLRSLEHLTGLKQLEELDLTNNSGLTVLDPLLEMKSLRKLNLTHCESLAGIKVLEQLTWLETLDVSKSSLTVDEVRQLKEKLVNTKVIAWMADKPMPSPVVN